MEIATLEQVQQMRSWLRCARNADEQLIDALPSLTPDEGDGEGYAGGVTAAALQ